MALLNPVPQQNVPIVDLQGGLATVAFMNWMITAFDAIINQTNNNTSLLAALQAQQQQILAVIQTLTAVQQNQSGGNAGAANSIVDVIGTTWVNGPVVALTGVVAGNLAFPGSGPAQINTTVVNPVGPNGTFNGAWRLVEIVGAVETVVFTGTYVAQRGRDDTGIFAIVYSTSDTTGTIPATSTGAVSYRLDIQAHDVTLGDFEVDQVQLALYVDRT